MNNPIPNKAVQKKLTPTEIQKMIENHKKTATHLDTATGRGLNKKAIK